MNIKLLCKFISVIVGLSAFSIYEDTPDEVIKFCGSFRANYSYRDY